MRKTKETFCGSKSRELLQTAYLNLKDLDASFLSWPLLQYIKVLVKNRFIKGRKKKKFLNLIVKKLFELLETVQKFHIISCT